VEQYAENHAGVCLGFSARCLVEDFFEGMKSQGTTACKPVQYAAGGFAVCPGRLLPAITEGTAAAELTRHLMDHIDEFFFLKLLDWETEFEYRFIVFAPAVDPDIPIDVTFEPCLRTIFLGEKFDAARIPDAKTWAADLGVDLLRLDWSTGRPLADPVP
jgi:hypothetical protein